MDQAHEAAAVQMLLADGFTEARDSSRHGVACVGAANLSRFHLSERLGDSKEQATERDEASDAANLQQRSRLSYSKRIFSKLKSELFTYTLRNLIFTLSSFRLFSLRVRVVLL